MTGVMSMRGPDGEGYLVSNSSEPAGFFTAGKTAATYTTIQHRQHIGLGHRRLSITDLSPAAAQPMCDTGGRFWIVFNGQIYNHVELRKELEGMGHTFHTDHSDTEVILVAYRQWGIGCLGRLSGTFAFCLWDTAENDVLIARDRVGVRPLYYTTHQGRFYFSSQMNAIITDRSIGRGLDDRAIYDYLTYTNVPAPSTIFKHIKKLPAAHYLFFKPGGEMEPERFWTPVTNKPLLTLSEDELAEAVREKLCEAVKNRMAADVKVGMLLSGGLDSSIMLACMSRHSPRPVSAYTVGFENKNGYQNEFGYARQVARMFKADYHELAVGEQDFFDFLPKMAAMQDEPIADPANIPLHFISIAARRDEVKVLLGGEGSDELFIGYQHWRLIYEFEKIFGKRPKLAGLMAFAHKNSFLKNKRPHYQAWATKLKNEWPAFWSGTELRTEEEKHSILSRDFLSRVGDYNSLEPLRGIYEHLTSLKPYQTFDWMTVSDLQHRLPDQLLARLDSMMMSAAIEGRHAFLDTGLIEMAMRIPPKMKTRGKVEKYILKKAFEGILPHSIIYRNKDSFTVPLNGLFSDTRKKEYMEVIYAFNKATGIFTGDYLAGLSSPQKLKEFWNTLNLALWHREHGLQ